MDTAAKSKTELIQELKKFQLKNDAIEKELIDSKLLVNKLLLTQYSVDNIIDSIFWIDRSAKFHFVNNAACKNLGYTKKELLSMTTFDVDPAFPKEKWEEHWADVMKKGSVVIETIHRTKEGVDINVEVTTNFVEFKGRQYNCAIARNITKQKQIQETLEKRMIALVRPLDSPESITFEELFNIEDLQQLQDEFAEATGVASIITHPDGTPITQPSNFCRLCSDIIRKTEIGCKNCYQSDAIIGKASDDGPTIQTCLSGGLWDAGAGIKIGGWHIANWLIGQVRDETQTEDRMRDYAREIGADEKTVLEAFSDVPAMSRVQFEKISNMLFTFANQLSTFAYQNVQQARFITDSKRAEDVLRKTHAKYSSMISNISDIIAIIDENGIIKYKSSNVEKLFGWDPKDLIGESAWKNIHPDDLDVVKKMFKFLIRKPNTVGTIEMRYRSKNNTFNWIEFNGINLLQDSNINGLLGTYHNIEERKLVEQSLKESETRFKALHNASFGGIAIHDKGIILECNNGLSEMTGYSIGELIGKNGLEIIAEKDRDYVLNKILDGYEKPYETIGVRKNGEEYPLRVEARNVPYKGKLVRTTEFRDLTVEKNAEKALRESEQKFKDIANLLPQTIFETDIQMKITFLNQHGFDEYRFTINDFENGINALETIIPEERERLKANFIQACGGELITNNEYSGLRKDCSTFPIIIYSNPIIKDEKPVGLRGICVNITHRKNAEEELHEQNKLLESQYEEHMQLNEVLRRTNYDLEKARQEAEKSNKAKSIFLANMSHELRTPLVGILGYSDLLVKFIEDEELNEMASGVNRTGKRLLDTISLILDLSKIESDNYETNIGQHNSMLLLREIFDGLKGGVLAKNLEYSYSPHIDEYNIDTDPEMFRIIFENILGNAIKFTSSGSVTISTKIVKNNEENYFSIVVTDTGIGIDEEDIPNIFEEFKQLSEGTTKNFQGSGLGLSITKRFVELLNGTINIKSRKGSGTTVHVEFPAY